MYPLTLTSAVVPEWGEPERQAEAKQEVDVRNHQLPRVLPVQHGLQQPVQSFTQRPHAQQTHQLSRESSSSSAYHYTYRVWCWCVLLPR